MRLVGRVDSSRDIVLLNVLYIAQTVATCRQSSFRLVWGCQTTDVLVPPLLQGVGFSFALAGDRGSLPPSLGQVPPFDINFNEKIFSSNVRETGTDQALCVRTIAGCIVHRCGPRCFVAGGTNQASIKWSSVTGALLNAGDDASACLCW
jgi:hypothetical protein